MIEIFKVLRRIWETQVLTQKIANWSPEFQSGYDYCLTMLLLAIEKHPALNLHIATKRLEDKVAKLEQENENVLRQLRHHKELNVQLTTALSLQGQNALKREVGNLLVQVHELQSALAEKTENEEVYVD